MSVCEFMLHRAACAAKKCDNLKTCLLTIFSSFIQPCDILLQQVIIVIIIIIFFNIALCLYHFFNLLNLRKIVIIKMGIEIESVCNA